MGKILRTVSKEDWNSNADGPTDLEIQSGSQQRIADALERMALGTTELETQKALEAKTRDWKWALDRYREAKKSNAALRGVITKLKKGR